MNNFSFLLIFITLLSIKNIFCDSLCHQKSRSEFMNIEINSPQKVSVGPNEEYCLKYKLTNKKDKIGLTFINSNYYLGEVLIYDSHDKIKKDESGYVYYIEKYTIGKKFLKEINVRNFNDYIYIIIKELKKYYFTDYFILYDSEVEIPLVQGVPLTIKNFMSNNQYIISFSSSKNVAIVYTSKNKGNKLINIDIDGKNEYSSKDENDILLNYESASSNIIYKITIKSLVSTGNQEFNIIYYEDIDKYKKLAKNENIEIIYLTSDSFIKNQNFYFYVDISNFNNINSINFKLDFMAKTNKYIDISTNIRKSSSELSGDDFNKYNFLKNELKYEYDLYSDEYIKFYFDSKDINEKYKYVLVKVEILKLKYNIPKKFIISIGNQLEKIDLTNDNYNQVKTESKSYIPTYLQLSLDKSSKYLFIAPYEDNILLIKGNILNQNGVLSKDILNYSTDLYVIDGLSDISIRIFGYQSNNAFNIQKYDPEQVTIIDEKDRTESVFSYKFNEEQCKPEKINYIIFKYDIFEYSNGVNSIKKYWTTDDITKMNIYYKNNTNIYNNNIFPSSEFKIEKDTEFVSNSHIDIFTINCSQATTLYIRPIKKKFTETTHEINYNNISTINIKSQKEIIQLMYPIKNRPKNIYFSLLLLEGKKVNLTPDTPGLFESVTIENQHLFTLKIETKKFKMDQMGIIVTSDGDINAEITETTDHEIHQYQNISKETKNADVDKNNFIIFLDSDVRKISVKFNKLENIEVCYGIVKLPTDNINYLPLAFNFNGTKQEKIQNNIELDNIYFKKNDKHKPFQAFIFSVKSNSIINKYNIEIYISYTLPYYKLNIILITSLIISLIIAILLCIYLYRSKKIPRPLSFDYNTDF